MKLSAQDLHKLYGFDLQENGLAALSGKLHPVLEKHIDAVKVIRDVYGLVERGEISKGKAEELVAAVIEGKCKRADLNERGEKITLLDAYSKFLEEHSYLDGDWRDEEPFAIDEFLRKK